MKRILINNVPVDNITTEEAYQKVVAAVEKKIFIQIVTPNIDHLALAQKDIKFLTVLKSSELSIADGMGIIYLSRLIKSPICENIGGRRLFLKLCEDSVKHRWRIFFLGSQNNIAKKAASVLEKRISGIQIVGAISPSNHFEMDNNETLKIIETINNSNADILFVGVGSPKSEKWIYDQRKNFNVSVAMVMGHGFDLIVGKVKPSPEIFTTYGFEWLYRLVQNPNYLFKRYVVRDIPYFLKSVLVHYKHKWWTLKWS
jgi:N-acetylglucosaminyldiphosphoundecaprenol N-acetyl-beta-D-mannosaminyltransferase